MTPDGPPPSTPSSPPPPDPSSRVDHDNVHISVGALVGGVAALVAAVAAVFVLVLGHGHSGPSNASAITTSWQRFVAVTENPAEVNSPSDGTQIAALLAPNSPACDGNCSDPTSLTLYTKLQPFKTSIGDITVTGDSATATVMQRGELGGEVTQTVQFSRHSGAWQISVLPDG